MSLRIKRFSRYAAIGVSTFFLDFYLFWVQTRYLNFSYIYAVAISFLAGISVNHFLSRKWVFAGSMRTFIQGYLCFLKFAVAGMAITAYLMWTLVILTHRDILTIRAIVACFVGMGNYLANLYLNFQVAGREL